MRFRLCAGVEKPSRCRTLTDLLQSTILPLSRFQRTVAQRYQISITFARQWLDGAFVQVLQMSDEDGGSVANRNAMVPYLQQPDACTLGMEGHPSAACD
jgi:hypothetical protein